MGDAASASAGDAAPGRSSPGVAVVDAGRVATETELEAYFAAPNGDVLPPIEAALLAGLATCEMKEGFIDRKCPAFARWEKGENKGVRTDKAGSKAVAAAYLAHASPAVRCVAASVLGQPWAPDTSGVLVEAARREKDPAVLTCMVRRGHGTWLVNGSPATRAFLIDMTKHADEGVRREAIARILHKADIGRGHPEVFGAVLDRLDADPSMAVRTEACKGLFDTEDERAMASFAKYLDPKTSPPLFAACFEGVVNAWARNPRHERPSRRAYELTLEVLERTPRTKESPPHEGTGLVGIGSAVAKPGDRDDEAWAKSVKPWFDVQRVRTALERVALDPDAHDEARYSAAYALKDLGAPKATFQRMVKACEKEGEHCTGGVLYVTLKENASPSAKRSSVQ